MSAISTPLLIALDIHGAAMDSPSIDSLNHVASAEANRFFPQRNSIAADWICKSYWFSWVIHTWIETRDYKWSNIEAFLRLLPVLVNSNPVIRGVQCDKLPGIFLFYYHVMIMGKEGVFAPPDQTDILSSFYLVSLLKQSSLHVEMFGMYVLTL